MTIHDPLDTAHQLLTEYTARPLHLVQSKRVGAAEGWDAVLEGAGVTFLIQCKSSAGAVEVGAALRQLRENGVTNSKLVPLLVVPFMGEVGKQLCRQAGVSWLDLSGNAHITTRRLRILVDGKPNQFAQRGRPSDPFAPKASRITRVLLLHPEVTVSQVELARKADVDKGFVSRIIKRLEQGGFVAREPDGRIRVDDPGQLLAAWRASYDFFRHHVIRAVVASRSGPDTLPRVSAALHDAGIRHAVTGLAAAWAYTSFAAYRTATLYVARQPDAAAMKLAGAREVSSGANLWLVVPNDDGVFAEERIVNGTSCVSPLQTYLDLKDQPERAEEAAEALRRIHLPWVKE